MGRPKKIKEKEEEEIDSLTEEEVTVVRKLTAVKPSGINISTLVNNVKGRYKKDKVMSNDIVVGNEICLSKDPKDYVSTDTIREYWGPLTGIYGAPFGRIIQIAGKPDSGKSTLSMLFMAAAQAAGHLVILWDSEKKFSTSRYEDRMDGDAKQLAVTRNKTIIEGCKHVAWYVKAAKEQNPDIKILIVWDSVGATMNSTDDDDENDDYSKQPGVSAKEISWAIKKLNKLIERFRNTKTGEETVGVLCVNQTYANIGSVGQKEKGGQELEYLSSLILQMTRKGDLTKIRNGNKVKYGITTRARVKKNHLFDGEDCIAELDLIVSAEGIKLATTVKGFGGVNWDGTE